MARFLAALRFLTVIPVPGALGSQTAELAGGLAFFPLVGLLLGLLAALIAATAGQLLTAAVTATLVVLLLLALSGGLHIDGLADSADGLFSSRPRQRCLEIMRDSHVGTMGVVAIVMVLALKITALAGLTPKRLVMAAILMPLAGRCLQMATMAFLPYARPEGGLASLFYARKTKKTAIGGLIALYVAAWLIAGPSGVLAAAGAGGAVWLFGRYCHYKLGGATGDTIGAASELAEMMVALVFNATQLG